MSITNVMKLFFIRGNKISICGKLFSSKVSSMLDAQSLELTLQDTNKIKILPDADIDQFRSYFPVLIKDLTQTNLITNLSEVKERLKIILEYNVTSGKQNRPLLLIAAYKFILGKNQLSEEKFSDLALLAWCIEMISSYILMLDDIVDNSETRRGRTAWYRLQKIGLNAINDATIIQMSVFKLLDKYFSNHPHYRDICNVFVEVILKTFVGQVLDAEKWCYENSTMENFNKIAYNKTGFYTFYFPLVNAMYMAERPDLELSTDGFDVFMELARYYQIQNDFLDVYGENFSGKLGTDIQEGKYSWLIVKAIEKASHDQIEILKNCYGKRNHDCVERVKLIYDELELRNSFEEEIRHIYRKVLGSISMMNNDLSRELMLRFVRVCLGYDSYLKKREP